MYLLDYILPQVAKLSHALYSKHYDLSLISSLEDATLNSLDDTILPSANWVLQLQDAREELKAATGSEVSHYIRYIRLDTCFFQERVGTLFIRLRITYPAGLDPPQKMYLSAFSIFDQRKVPSPSTHELPLYGDSSFQALIGQFGRNLPAKSLEGTEFEKAAIVSSDLSTEVITYRQLLRGDNPIYRRNLNTYL